MEHRRRRQSKQTHSAVRTAPLRPLLCLLASVAVAAAAAKENAASRQLPQIGPELEVRSIGRLVQWPSSSRAAGEHLVRQPQQQAAGAQRNAG